MSDSWSLIGDDGQPVDDFRFDEQGRIACDPSVATAIIMVLDNHLGRWWAYPGHGSRIASLMSRDPSADFESALISATREALSQLERDGRIHDVEVRVELVSNRAQIAVNVLDVGLGAPVRVEIASP